jgi:hypothetical protein
VLLLILLSALPDAMLVPVLRDLLVEGNATNGLPAGSAEAAEHCEASTAPSPACEPLGHSLG